MASDEDSPVWSDAEEDTIFHGLVDELMEEFESSTFSVITKESILAAQKEDLCKVMDLLGISMKHARAVLISHRWNVVRIFELLEQKGKERFLSETGVIIIENKGPVVSNSSSKVTCNTCFEEVYLESTTNMDCGHCYCNDCWANYFILMIHEGQRRLIRCMAPMCNTVCDEDIIRKLVSGWKPDVTYLFDLVLLESYFEDNEKVKACPSKPHCGNAIRVEGDIYCEVECACGLQFCFACLSEAHSPCSCTMWKLWTQKCQDDSANVNWIEVNIKPCPRCQTLVEKIGGFDLVSCVCGQIFCWLCGEATASAHDQSGDNCGSFKKEQEHAMQELYRYIHYHNRYKTLTDSLKLESNLKRSIQKNKSTLQSEEIGINAYGLVMNGLNILFKSRRILSYSYPFTFYMFGSELFNDEMTPQDRVMKQNLFEHQQQQLESNVEKLSMFLEKDFQNLSHDEILQILENVKNLSEVIDKLLKQMYKFIENELLYPLRGATYNIAPYKSKGIGRA